MLGVFLDIETNGIDPFRHGPLEVALQIIDLFTGSVEDRYESIVRQPKEVWEKSDPVSLQINGFTEDQLSSGKEVDQVAMELTHLFQQNRIQQGGAVFICQNPSFDRPFFSQFINADFQKKLNWPYHWLDLASMYWALAIQNGRKSNSPLPPFLGLQGFLRIRLLTFMVYPRNPLPTGL